ncbi:hypothetical protein AOL_s00091g63 [Orbilia oligospora ATCC 24927]|uniref:Uncharacterized protein n=1 Tax=Arthrobotrys oligospora (strain ATCC 24927 / CBS 115.81 / DSM 1491) TaxID=756982 RepID=G1XI11_ARTOA|nr:hypothetical protein AOL_s00091g63 [Orbilia oligospora ATCC 24927]EGX47242.1 hypothetical protein AOL_s00091g63 [Orbilia oligospora ATCC 24927]
MLSFSSNGKELTTAVYNRKISLWDLATQQLMKTFEFGVNLVEIGFCSAVKQLVALTYPDHGDDGDSATVKRWAIATGELVCTFPVAIPYHQLDRFKADFSFDGGKLALIGEDNTEIWNLAAGQQEASMRILDKGKACYDFDRKQPVQVFHGEIIFGDIKTRDLEKIRTIGQRVDSGRDEVCDIASSRDGKRVATALYNGFVQLWDVDACLEEIDAQSKTSTENREYITTVTLSPDGTRLVLGLESSTVLWDTASDQPIKTFKGISDVFFSPNSKFMALILTTRYRLACKAKLFDASDVTRPKITLNVIKKRSLRRYLPPFLDNGGGNWFLTACFSPGSQRLALATGFGEVKVLDTATGKLVQSLQPFDRSRDLWRVGMAFPDHGAQLVLQERGTITIWDIETKQKLQQIEIYYEDSLNYIKTVAISPDRKLLATASWRNLFQLWDTATGQLLEAFQSEFSTRGLHFSSDCLYLETDGETIVVSSIYSLPLRIISQKPSGRILLTDGWVTRHGQNILWLPHGNRGRRSDSNDRLLILGQYSGEMNLFEFTNVPTEVEDT